MGSNPVPFRQVIAYYPDGDDVNIEVGGWHRTDGPNFKHDEDDGQDNMRLEAVLGRIPDAVPRHSIQYVFRDGALTPPSKAEVTF